MSELQATLEFSIELHNFYNVDLFQRGFYQVRCNLRSSPKLVPAKVEVSLPRTKNSDLIFPPSIINGTAVSKTFQILYRNEEVLLDDVILYRVHLVLDSARIEETLGAAEFSLDTELWFSEDSHGMEQHSSIEKVSSRSLQLDWTPSHGLHYHLPVLFDYFHLSCVSLTIHGALVSIHQPYLPSPRLRGKTRNSSPANTTSLSTMETVLFGQVKYGTSRTRLAIACRIYQEVCTLLLQSLESLQQALQHLSGLVPDLQRPSVRLVDCRRRMKQLLEVASGVETEDEFLTRANSDISQLCAENVLLWNRFLDAFTLREVIRQHLAMINHHHRVKRFAEGFFRMTNPRKSALCCLDTKHQHYHVVSEAVRRSDYFSQLPSLQVSCRELDGTCDSLPIIFEDVYSDLVIPKRTSTASVDLSNRLWEGCILVSSQVPGLPQGDIVGRPSTRPSSVPVNLDITAVRGGDQGVSELGHLSQESLDRLKRDLSILVQATKQATNNHTTAGPYRKEKLRKKKISLPLKVDEDAEAGKGKGKERKRSIDSSLAILSPSLSPDMKLFFREKLRLERRGKDRKGRLKEKGSTKNTHHSSKENRGTKKGDHFLKGGSGYSHLDCCAKVPYNLAEEPDQVEGMKQPRGKQDCHNQSFTSRELQCQEKEGKLDLPSDQKDQEPVCPQKTGEHATPGLSSPHSCCLKQTTESSLSPPDMVDEVDSSQTEEVATLGGMAKVREIVLSSAKAKEEHLEDIDSSESSISEASGWVSNNSRRSSSSTSDQTSSAENAIDVKKTHNNNPKNPSSIESNQPNVKAALMELSTSRPIPDLNKNTETTLPTNLVRIPLCQMVPSAVMTKVNEEGIPSIKEDNLSSEPCPIKPLGPSELRSPRLLLTKTSRSRSEEPAVRPTPQPLSPLLSRARHQSERVSTRSQSPVRRRGGQSSKPPLPETSGPPVLPPEEFRDPPVSRDSSRLEARVRDSNFARLRHQKFVQNKSNSVHSSSEGGRSDVKTESEVAIKKLYEAVSEITSSDKKMSRSNTISFGDQDKQVHSDSGGIVTDKSSSLATVADIRPRKLNSSDNLMNQQRLFSSMHSIDRTLPETIMEDKSLPVRSDTGWEVGSLPPTGFSCLDWVPSKSVLGDEKLLARIAYMQGPAVVSFLRAREQFRSLTSFPGQLYSDLGPLTLANCSQPYFTKTSLETSVLDPTSRASHLIVCVHGLDGNSADLRLVKTYLEMALPSANLEFLMSEINQLDTFLSFEDMTRKLVNEIMYHVKTCDLNIEKISFIGHSLGCILIRSAIQKPELVNFSDKFHTFLSLSGPHLGTMYNNSGLVNAGMWMMQKWKKSGSLQQLALKDSGDIRKTFMFKLAEKSNLHLFKNVLLAGSSQDKYVPIHSARVELCKSAVKDTSVMGSAYREMVTNILNKVVESDTVELVRYDIHHALPNNTNSLIGRAAHIAVLDSELFIEKFLVIAVLKYFQ